MWPASGARSYRKGQVAADDALAGAVVRPRRQLIYRHSIVVRFTHWINVMCLAVLLMSGLQIFNAHPALYWGKLSDFAHPILSMSAVQPDGGPQRGVTTVFGHSFDTTGVLGLSQDDMGHPWARGFPAWATLPSDQSLADGRLWHFFFAWLFVANGALYMVASLLGGHIWRDVFRPGSSFAVSAGRPGTTCCSASRRVRRPAITTCCRNWLIWWWYSGSCRSWC